MHDIDQTVPTTTVTNYEYAEVGCHVLRFESGEGPFFDDLTKQELPKLLVKAARRK